MKNEKVEISKDRLTQLLKDNSGNIAAIARTMDCDPQTVRRRCKEHKLNPNFFRPIKAGKAFSMKPPTKQTKFESDGSKGVATSSEVHTLNELLEKCDVDLDVWEVKKYIINKWDVTAFKYNPGGTKRSNYQIKAWLEKKTDIVDHKKFKKELIEDIQKYAKKVPKIKYEKPKEKHLLEVNVFDLHLSKLCWKEEGEGNYDVKIARKRYLNSIATIAERAKSFGIEKIAFPVGNDFFHSDKDVPYPMTTKGTPQQTDLRWQKAFREGRQVNIEAINYLSQFAPVDIVVVGGNHDYQKSFYLGEVLKAHYHKNPNVHIDNRPCPRKYFRYHKNLIGYTHGRKSSIALKRLIQMMPQEVPKLWARTKFREWHLGDIHHKKVIKLESTRDYQGIVMRYMRSLSEADDWHARKGYVGAVRGAEGYIFHKDYGIVAILNHNID